MKPLVVGGAALLSTAPLALAWRRGRAARGVARWRNARVPARWPSASVIVPAWNEQGTLAECLDALGQTRYDGEWEIIVMAGGPDGTFDAARAYAETSPRCIQVLPQRDGGGKNGAMNDAAARANGEVLVFLDADAVVTPDWLSAMVVAVVEGGCGASTGKFVPARRTLVSRALEMGQTLEYEARGRVQLQGSGGMAVRREAFVAIGGLPEGGAFADDWDLSARLAAGGYRLAFAPAAVSTTERPSDLREWWQNEVRWRRIHLLSLLRVGDVELANPVKAAKALYPYATAWGALAATGAAVVSSAVRLRGRSPIRALALLAVGPILARELAGPVEVAAYTGEPRWLDTLLVVPVLTAMGWAAAALATLTAHNAPVHYKGPRRAAPDAGRAGQIEDVMIGAVG
jgi:GT2 family glycosyltransferase